ncbi:MAG: glycosyltransferase family 1 protein [Flavobacteriales bacterium]
MKIAINTRHLLPHRLDGMGWFTLEIFKRIALQHPEVEFHFIFDRKFHEEFIFSENIIPHVIGPQARHPYLMRVWYDWSIKRLLKKIQPDLFISPDAQLSLTTSIPQLVVIHDINFEHYPKDIPAVYTRDLKRRTPKFAQKANRIVTVSEFSKQDIIDHYGVSSDKIGVVNNGANEVYQPLSDQEKIVAKQQFTAGSEYFIFISSIHPRKNLQRILPAFFEFKKQSKSDVKMLVVGNIFWQDDALKAAIEKGKSSGDVVMAGRLNPDELRLALGGALANIYTSYFEGFGIPVVEAFQAGVPVVTSNVTSLPEIAGDAALQVDPFSVNEITQAMLEIFNNLELRKQLISKGFERSKQFTWQIAADKMWQEINKSL